MDEVRRYPVTDSSQLDRMIDYYRGINTGRIDGIEEVKDCIHIILSDPDLNNAEKLNRIEIVIKS